MQNWAKIWAPIIVGVGMGIIAFVFPMLYPNTPIWILQLLLYFAIFLIFIWPTVFLYKFLSRLNLRNKSLMYIPGIILIIIGIIWIIAVYRNTVSSPLPKEEKLKVSVESKNQEIQPDATSLFQDRLLFFEAAKEGNVSAIELLLDKGVDVNTTDKDGNTALIWAIRHNQRACILKLIEKGCKVNAKTNDGNTAFTFASIKNYDDIVDILKKSGAISVKYQNPKILNAAFHGDINTLYTLLEKSGSPNTIDRIGGETPLMYAVGRNHIKCVELLLQFGADVNIRAKDGHTVFDDAKDKPEMLKLIESPVKQTAERKSHKDITFIVFAPNASIPEILDSNNISSITDNGILNFTFTFDEPLENENYMIKMIGTANVEYDVLDRTRNSFTIQFGKPCPDRVKLEFVF